VARQIAVGLLGDDEDSTREQFLQTDVDDVVQHASGALLAAA
jgi:hypothetical protein